ncbi:MAG: hypothetical protein UT03_C0042G0008 [Candidatus Moranbacteria bacterium GW2011_GWD2_38_7]|nr:MAG: hypothetical protein UT03_C0042G0008 [Candidatus Moranbacteria bacterium GW2011_GWD2_38_7]
MVLISKSCNCFSVTKRKMYASDIMRQIESFFWGIIAALGALFVQLLVFIGFSFFSNSQTEFTFSQLFILPQFVIAAAFIEETFRYLIISKVVEMYSLSKSFIINSLFVGLGFAATEFLLLETSGNLPNNQILSELAIVHIGISGIIGYLVAVKNPQRVWTFIYVVTLATILHSSYNFLIQKREFFQSYLILILLGLIILTNLFNLLRINRKLAP